MRCDATQARVCKLEVAAASPIRQGAIVCFVGIDGTARLGTVKSDPDVDGEVRCTCRLTRPSMHHLNVSAQCRVWWWH